MSAKWDYARIGVGRIRSPEETAATREYVRGLWRQCDYTRGTPAEKYFIRRGLPWLVDCECLRFYPACPHPSRAKLPAMVAQILDGRGNVAALHRTFLDPDGRKANIEPQKASIGSFAGGAIRLHPPCVEMVVAEGVETAASAGEMFRLPCWSAIACGNLAHNMALPPEVRRVIVVADPDPQGERAAILAGRRWEAEGRSVRIARTEPGIGDFNDLLLSERLRERPCAEVA